MSSALDILFAMNKEAIMKRAFRSSGFAVFLAAALSCTAAAQPQPAAALNSAAVKQPVTNQAATAQN